MSPRGKITRRPLIGVSGPDRGGDAAWLFSWLNLALAGARAVRITPRRHSNRETIDALDGLIIGGGADVDPKLYGQELLHIVQAPRLNQGARSLRWQLIDLLMLPLTWLVRKAAARCVSPLRADPARDEMEMRLLDSAVRRRLPVLGICRGEQLINVYFGGSLHQSLKSFYVEEPDVRTILPRKRVIVEAGTRLSRVLGKRPRAVNALHQQAIDTLGASLIVAAKDRNGIIQAIEHESLPFVIGVQWHPEYLPQHKRQRAIFEALVREARRQRAIPVTQPAPGLRIAG
ncbi:gamma-glutamyl-gamma-aminobutyrate hydrolase family protein [soil metagenome]